MLDCLKEGQKLYTQEILAAQRYVWNVFDGNKNMQFSFSDDSSYKKIIVKPMLHLEGFM